MSSDWIIFTERLDWSIGIPYFGVRLIVRPQGRNRCILVGGAPKFLGVAIRSKGELHRDVAIVVIVTSSINLNKPSHGITIFHENLIDRYP